VAEHDSLAVPGVLQQVRLVRRILTVVVAAVSAMLGLRKENHWVAVSGLYRLFILRVAYPTVSEH